MWDVILFLPSALPGTFPDPLLGTLQEFVVRSWSLEEGTFGEGLSPCSSKRHHSWSLAHKHQASLLPPRPRACVGPASLERVSLGAEGGRQSPQVNALVLEQVLLLAKAAACPRSAAAFPGVPGHSGGLQWAALLVLQISQS